MAARTARRVTVYVHVTNPETAEAVLLAPGDEVPRWASKLITNPKCFVADTEPTKGEETHEAPPATTPPPSKPARGKQAQDTTGAPAEPGAGDELADETEGDTEDETGEAQADGDEPPTFKP